MSLWVHCDNECGEKPLPREADELQAVWLAVEWHGVRQDFCSAACATEAIERQQAEDAELALSFNDAEEDDP